MTEKKKHENYFIGLVSVQSCTTWSGIWEQPYDSKGSADVVYLYVNT